MTMIDGDKLLALFDDLISDTQDFPQTAYIEGALKGFKTSKIFTQTLIENENRKQALLEMYTKGGEE